METLLEVKMTSLGRMLSILKMFGPDSLAIEVEDIAQKMSLSRATAYRYVKELCDSGLLTRADGLYTLGPRIIELDWMMRLYDPLIHSGRELMANFSKATGLTVYLSVYFDGHIINTHIEAAKEKHGFTFGRGRPLPLFKGAQSKVLVSFQKPHRLKKIYEEFISQDPELDLSWKEFSGETKKIRKNGYCQTHDELNLGLTGIAAPIIDNENLDEIRGSIAIVGSTAGFELFDQAALIERLQQMTRTIASSAHQLPR